MELAAVVGGARGAGRPFPSAPNGNAARPGTVQPSALQPVFSFAGVPSEIEYFPGVICWSWPRLVPQVVRTPPGNCKSGVVKCLEGGATAGRKEGREGGMEGERKGLINGVHKRRRQKDGETDTYIYTHTPPSVRPSLLWSGIFSLRPSVPPSPRTYFPS